MYYGISKKLKYFCLNLNFEIFFALIKQSPNILFMYLFDKSRHGRQNFKISTNKPKLKWKRDLRTNPTYGAESTAVIDDLGNLYFGSHSGNFYSLSKIGEIRWTFSTSTKIYSSPVLIEKLVFFAGGDGILYCLDLEGNLVWKRDLTKPSEKMFKKKTINKWIHFPFTYDFHKKRNINYKCWSSPNYFEENIYITAYGKGLYCINLRGEVIWSFDLGFPRFQLSGVAIDQEGNVYCSSRSGCIYSFKKNGILNWKILIKKNWENWGNPVFCDIKKFAYFFFSKKEKEGLLVCVDPAGQILWKLELGSIRGSCAISKDGESIFCCDLDGYIYRVSSKNGEIEVKKKITEAQRGLWITPTIDLNSNILLATKDSNTTGRVILMNPDFEFIWEFNTNKVLSIPIISQEGDLFFGSWDGYYYCL